MTPEERKKRLDDIQAMKAKNDTVLTKFNDQQQKVSQGVYNQPVQQTPKSNFSISADEAQYLNFLSSTGKAGDAKAQQYLFEKFNPSNVLKQQQTEQKAREQAIKAQQEAQAAYANEMNKRNQEYTEYSQNFVPMSTNGQGYDYSFKWHDLFPADYKTWEGNTYPYQNPKFSPSYVNNSSQYSDPSANTDNLDNLTEEEINALYAQYYGG